MQITIAREQTLWSALEVSFRQLGLDQKMALPHVDFGSVSVVIDQRNGRPKAELWR